MALSSVVSEIFTVEKYSNLEILLNDQSRSLKVVPFNRQGMVSCQCSIVTLSLRCTIYEIIDFKYATTLKTGLEFRQGH